LIEGEEITFIPPVRCAGLEIKPLDKSDIGKGERFERRGKTRFFVKRKRLYE